MNADRPSEAKEQGEPFRVLFVCTGNTCRSPMAEAAARRVAQRRGWAQVEVRSAGTSTGGGATASGGAARAAAARGLDLSAHRSAPLTREEVAWADLILVMTPTHLARVEELGGGDRAHLLTAFAAGSDDGYTVAVPDPFGGPDEVYVETLALLERLVDAALDRLAPLVSP